MIKCKKKLLLFFVVFLNLTLLVGCTQVSPEDVINGLSSGDGSDVSTSQFYWMQRVQWNQAVVAENFSNLKYGEITDICLVKLNPELELGDVSVNDFQGYALDNKSKTIFYTIGSSNIGSFIDNNLENPTVLAGKANGNLYVYDKGKNKIAKYKFNGSVLEFVGFINLTVSAVDLATDKNLTLYLLDNAGSVLKISDDGSFSAINTTFKMNDAKSLDVSPDGNIYVLNNLGASIVKINQAGQMLSILELEITANDIAAGNSYVYVTFTSDNKITIYQANDLKAVWDILPLVFAAPLYGLSGVNRVALYAPNEVLVVGDINMGGGVFIKDSFNALYINEDYN